MEPMAAPAISVVMTTYNGAAHIAETLDSLLVQSWRDFEVVIVDDGSTDETVDILSAYQDSRIRLLRNETNQGIAAARNIGLREARGRFIAMQDQDDISLPDRLQITLAAFEDEPDAAMVAGQAEIMPFGSVEPPDPSSSSPVTEWRLLSRCNIAHSAVAFRAVHLKEYGLAYDPQYPFAEDYVLFNRIAELAPVKIVPRVISRYREHGGNASTRFNVKMIASTCSFMHRHFGKLLQRSVEPSAVAAFVATRIEGLPASSPMMLDQAGLLLQSVLENFIARHSLSPDEEEIIRRDAARSWWRMASVSASRGGRKFLDVWNARPALISTRPPAGEWLKVRLRAALYWADPRPVPRAGAECWSESQ